MVSYGEDVIVRLQEYLRDRQRVDRAWAKRPREERIALRQDWAAEFLRAEGILTDPPTED